MNPTCEPQRSKQEKPPLSPACVGEIRGFVQTVHGTMEQGSVAVVLDGHLDILPGKIMVFLPVLHIFNVNYVAMENTATHQGLKIDLGRFGDAQRGHCPGGERHGRTCGRWRCCGRDETSAG